MHLAEVRVAADTRVETGSPQSRLARALSQRKIPSLDGLRAVSVLLVILHHTGMPYAPHGRGVLTFFVLSGFLITWLMLGESERRGEISIRNFYVRRVLRIFPAFYVYMAIVIAMQVLARRMPPLPVVFDYLSSIAYVANYRLALTHRHNVFITHTWALSIEEQFYLIWPWVLVAFHRDVRKLAYGLLAAIAFVDIYRVVLLEQFHVGNAWLNQTFDSRVDHLLVGCLLAVLLKQGILTRFWQVLTSSVWVSIVPLALTVASIALAFRHELLYKIGIGFVVDPLLTAILLVQVIAFGDSWLWGWLNWRPISYLGQISYGMFLYHMLSYKLVMEVFGSDPPLWIRIPAVTAVAALFGAASFHLVEKKFLRLKTKFGDSPSRRRTLISPPQTCGIAAD